MRYQFRHGMSITSEARRATTGDSLLWAGWAAWTLIVLVRYFLELWRMALHPAALWSLASQGLYQTLKCLVIGVVALLAAAAAVRTWRAVRQVLGERAVALALFATALGAYPWFATRHALESDLSTIRTASFPAIGEALARNGSGVIGASVVALAAVAFGRIFVAVLRLDKASGIERHLLAASFGIGALSYASFALAIGHVYRPGAIALLLAVTLIAGAVARWAFPSPGGANDDQAPVVSTPWHPRREGVWLALAFAGSCFALVAAFAPETEYDALWYHLYLPKLWLAAGRPVDLLQEFPSLYPLTWELVFGAGMVMGGTIAAKLLHASCLAVIAVTLWAASRRYAPGSSAYVAIGLLLTTPTVLWESGTAYIDLALAMYAALGCYALARFVETAERRWLFAAGLEFGLGAATKHLGLIVLGIACAILTWVLWRRKHSAFAIVSTVAVLVVIGIAIPLPWYLRSWYGSGNPFFPELYGVFGGGPASRWDALSERGLAAFKAHFGFHQGIVSFLRLPWDITMHSAFFGGALGPLWLLLLPAAIAGRAGLRYKGAIAAAALAYLAVWASPISSYQMRFLIPVLAGLALIAAEGWQTIIDATAVSRRLRAAAAVAIWGVAFLNLPPWMSLHESDRGITRGWLTHVLRTSPVSVVIGRESEQQYLTRTLPSYGAWQYANAHLPPDAIVLAFSGGDHLYSDRTRIPHDSVLARPAVWTAKGAADVAQALQRLGVGYALFDRRMLPQLEEQGLPIAGPEVQRACATLYQDRRYRLCRFELSSKGVPAASGPSPAERRDHLDVLRQAFAISPRG